MTYAADTDFLVAVEVRGHEFHRAACDLLASLLDDGHQIGVTPQGLAEFIHIATDPRRLSNPMTVKEAIERAERWWQAKETTRILPDFSSTLTWMHLLQHHRLGRKRLLDTMLAAICKACDVQKIITNNEEDFRVFGFLEVVGFRERPDGAEGRFQRSEAGGQ